MDWSSGGKDALSSNFSFRVMGIVEDLAENIARYYFKCNWFALNINIFSQSSKILGKTNI